MRIANYEFRLAENASTDLRRGAQQVFDCRFSIFDSVMNVKNSTPAGLHVHVPFCSSVCPYCDFAVTIAGEERRAGYVAAIEREAALRSGTGLRFDTAYIGGGTPTALTPGQLGRLLESIRARLDFVPDVQLFLEVNPEDVTAESVKAWGTSASPPSVSVCRASTRTC